MEKAFNDWPECHFCFTSFPNFDVAACVRHVNFECKSKDKALEWRQRKQDEEQKQREEEEANDRLVNGEDGDESPVSDPSNQSTQLSQLSQLDRYSHESPGSLADIPDNLSAITKQKRGTFVPHV